jgi:hypothetical protein
VCLHDRSSSSGAAMPSRPTHLFLALSQSNQIHILSGTLDTPGVFIDAREPSKSGSGAYFDGMIVSIGKWIYIQHPTGHHVTTNHSHPPDAPRQLPADTRIGRPTPPPFARFAGGFSLQFECVSSPVPPIPATIPLPSQTPFNNFQTRTASVTPHACASQPRCA